MYSSIISLYLLGGLTQLVVILYIMCQKYIISKQVHKQEVEEIEIDSMYRRQKLEVNSNSVLNISLRSDLFSDFHPFRRLLHHRCLYHSHYRCRYRSYPKLFDTFLIFLPIHLPCFCCDCRCLLLLLIGDILAGVRDKCEIFLVSLCLAGGVGFLRRAREYIFLDMLTNLHLYNIVFACLLFMNIYMHQHYFLRTVWH